MPDPAQAPSAVRREARERRRIRGQRRHRRRGIEACQRQQVCERESAPGRAQHREPGRAVPRMQHRLRERHQVADRGAVGERFQLHAAVGDALVTQRGHHRRQRCPAPHQHRNRGPRRTRRRGQHRGHRARDRRAHLVLVRVEQRVHAHPVARDGRVHYLGGRVTHRPALEVVLGRQQSREAAVHPVHDRRAGAEVAGQPQRRQRDPADTLALGLQEQRDVGLPERIDRLHRVADAEQRAPVALLPAGEQQLQQLFLRRRRVLVFVHEQVADAVVERERKLGRRRGVAQRIACRRRHGGMVQAAALGEMRHQFRDRVRQHGHQRLDAIPLRVAQRRRRQLPDARQRGGEAVHFRQRLELLLHPPLERFPRRPGRGSRKALVLVHLPAQRAVRPRREQQVRERAPGRDCGGRGRWQSLDPCERRQRALGAAGGRGLADHREQAGRQRRRHDVGRAREFGLERRLEQAVDRLAQPAVAGRPEQLRQPDLARSQHPGDQPRKLPRLVIQGPRQALQWRGPLAALLQRSDQAPCRLAIERRCVVDQRRRHADARRQRQPSRQPVVEPVDGLHMQARRIALELPAERTTPRQRRSRECVRFLLVRPGIGGQRLRRRSQCAHDAVAHLRGRLAREGNGDDLLRAVHGREQAQVAQRQQAGLAGARRGLDDERSRGIHRLAPDPGIAACLRRRRHAPRLRHPPGRLARRGTARPDGTGGRCCCRAWDPRPPCHPRVRAPDVPAMPTSDP